MSSFRRMASNHRAEIAKHEHENSLQGGVAEKHDADHGEVCSRAPRSAEEVSARFSRTKSQESTLSGIHEHLWRCVILG